MREICNAIFSVLGTGCPWRCLPHDFAIWSSVYPYFHYWCHQGGVLEPMNQTLSAQLRQQVGGAPSASAASLDCQSAKTTEKGGNAAMTVARK
jgi:transposase